MAAFGGLGGAGAKMSDEGSTKREWLQRVLGVALAGSIPDAGGVAARQAARDRLKAARPGIEAALRRSDAAAGEVRNLAKALGELMLGPDFDPADANAELDRLDKLLAADAGSSPGLSLVKLGKSRIEWIGLRGQACSDLEKLQTALLDIFEEDDEQQAALAKALDKLDELIGKLSADLEEELDAVLNEADPAKRGDKIAQARTTMNRFTGFVAEDPIMSKLDGNEIMPGLKVTGPLSAKLQEISASLG
ncbi:MAG TPA: hypothetical protein VM689_01190 [Aliidongia sp.]|nr:hypothetical protein [Aliidongia sp.]